MIPESKLIEIEKLIREITPCYRGKWFFTPEKTGTRQDGSEYKLDMQVSYGEEGDDRETYDLFHSCDLGVFKFIAAANPEFVASLVQDYKRRGEALEIALSALNTANEHCLCTRNDTGFDYGEVHDKLGKAGSGKRWRTPDDIILEALASVEEILK